MQKEIQDILRECNIFSHQNRGVTVCVTRDKEAGSALAAEIIKKIAMRQTVLYLSGGSTPDMLYGRLSGDEDFLPGAIGLIDERYGDPKHESSNEAMIEKTGLLRYVRLRSIPFYPILTGQSLSDTAEYYDDTVRSLSVVYRQAVAVLGVGADGHTAGIAGNRHDFENPIFGEQSKLVSSFDDPTGPFHARITMTFLGLSMLDFLVVMAFGENKQKALNRTFADGSEEEIPARFYTNPDIATKTLFITDQKV